MTELQLQIRYRSARRAVPAPNDCLCPPFWFTQNTFLAHHVTIRKQTIMKKGTIAFKHTSRLKYSRFFCKIVSHQLLCINVTQLSVLLTRLYGCAAEERCISLQNRYRYFVSDYDLKQYVKFFFLRPAAFVFLEQSQDFLKVAVSGATTGKGPKGFSPLYQSY